MGIAGAGIGIPGIASKVKDASLAWRLMGGCSCLGDESLRRRGDVYDHDHESRSWASGNACLVGRSPRVSVSTEVSFSSPSSITIEGGSFNVSSSQAS